MSTSAAAAAAPEALDSPLPITAFERRFGHPPGLVILFFAEMWERFSFYGMRGLLKFYMANYLFVTIRQTLQGKAYDGHGDPTLIKGWGFVQSLRLPFIGRLLPDADPAKLHECVTAKAAALMKGDLENHIAPVVSDLAHQIAAQTCHANEQGSVLYGAYIGLVYATPILGGYLADKYFGQRRTVVVGGALMALGHFVMAFEDSFFIALILLIVGNGAFKPNVSTQVGSLYKQGDPRRDRAFAFFYVGINLGAFICNLVCGTLAAVYGWHYGFAAAGVGMVLGLITYVSLGPKYLAPDPVMQRKAAEKARGAEAAAEKKAKAPAEPPKPFTRDEWARIGGLIVLCILNVAFWAVYEQQGNTMATWADESTRWPIVFGFQIPATWFQSVNPAFIFLFTPLLTSLWKWQNDRGKEPNSVLKMAMGCTFLGASFVLMIIGARIVGVDKGSAFWPIACTAVITLGELYLSPIGLSLVTKAAPARIVSLMMGVWFLSNFFGNVLSGAIGVYYTRMPKELFFLLLLAIGVGAGAAIFAMNKPLKKAIGAENL